MKSHLWAQEKSEILVECRLFFATESVFKPKNSDTASFKQLFNGYFQKAFLHFQLERTVRKKGPRPYPSANRLENRNFQFRS